MPGGDEAAVLEDALRDLGLAGIDTVLADHPGRRRVVRAGDVVIKAFAALETPAWARELAGLRALAGTGLAVELAASGRRWTATRWLDGVVPMDEAVANAAIHAALGPTLAALHGVDAGDLAPWPVVDRVRQRLAEAPSTCPSALATDVARMLAPLLPLVADGAFVHGDWGTANVLVRRDDPTAILAVIDLEDAHRGDAAEDFKWPVLAGPASEEYIAMAAAYGRDLGRHAVERLVVAGAELCLDVLGWELSEPARSRFHGRCRQTLEELVAGAWPEWPHG